MIHFNKSNQKHMNTTWLIYVHYKNVIENLPFYKVSLINTAILTIVRHIYV